MRQMYKVFINQKVVFLSEYSDSDTINPEDHWLRCENRKQIKVELSQFIANPEASQLFLCINGDCENLFRLFSSLFSFIEAAGGLVRDKQGRILFILRLGLWDLPKGKTKPGEDAPQAALREVSEETGLENLTIVSKLPSTYHVFERKGSQYLKRTQWYEMKSAGEGPLVPQMEEDITEVRWYRPEDISLPLSNTYPAISELVEDYVRNSSLFH